MKKRTLILMILIMLSLSACNIPLTPRATPTVESIPTLEPTPVPERMQLYYGEGMQITLPRSYISEDVKTSLPSIIETVTNLVGSSEGVAGDLIRDLEGNVAWYGYDGESPAVYPTRFISIKNKSLSAFPMGIVTMGLETILKNNNAEVSRDDVTLGGRSVIRFTYSKDGNAWAAYLFKEEVRLWINVFITTPANMAALLGEFDQSIGTISIDPIAE